jgi:GNAT superfamily N-acetyltransferase
VTIPSDGREVTGLPVRRLTAADLPACSALAVDRGWEPAPEKWRLLLDLGEIYGADDPDGGLAGAVALTRYGPELAAIGKMLVAQRRGRQGLGGRLMRHALDQVGDTVTCLLATQYGRPLYERLGFRAIDRSVRYIGPLAAEPAEAGPPPGHAPPRPAGQADLAGIAELDRRSFGADRGSLLAALPRLADRFMVSDGPAGPGFGAAWRSADTLTIGPLVAQDLTVATALITSLAAGSDQPVRLEVPGRHPGLADWAAARGLTVRSQSTLMVHGGDLPGAREHVYGPANMALC